MQDTTADTQEKKPGAPWFGALAALVRNIVAGFRLAVFLPVQRTDFREDANQAVLSLLSLAAAGCLYSYLIALPNPQFNVYGIGAVAVTYICMMMGLWVLAAVRGIPHALPMLFVAVATASITSGAVAQAGTAWVGWTSESPQGIAVAWGIFMAGVLWVGLIANRAQRLVLGSHSWKNGLASLLYLAILVAPAFGLPRQALWYPGYESDEATAGQEEYPPIDVEKTFYAQRPMMDAALSDIGPGRPGVTDLYFVGFAGFAGQDVFMKEVDAAQSMFDDRFDTRHRSVALINNRATVDDVPLANGSNLRLALAGLGERMNLDEDVLFLFLTSHGSPGRLATAFWPMQLNDLTPGELREVLDEAGIRWRVIVVSACYSGSFVEALESEETLVITAARKDRTSFGCSDEAEFTYFGRALINEALRNTYSFVEAFGMASAAVAERESEQDFTPSVPQIFIGRNISAKLGELEARLKNIGNVAAGG